MIILDTNVISALMRPTLNSVVVDWLDRQAAATVWTTSITVLEIRSGLLRLPNGRRKDLMMSAFDTLLTELLAGRIYPFNIDAAEAAAIAATERIGAGLNIDTLDTQIAGICISRGAGLATRNVKHFRDLDIRLINPWEAC
jgi:toxin FitB